MKARLEDVILAACPQCKAAAGEKCRNYLGRKMAPHGGRVRVRDPIELPPPPAPKPGDTPSLFE